MPEPELCRTRPPELHPSVWSVHIPFAMWLVKAHQPKVIAELGVHWGNSFFAWCQAVKECELPTRVYGIDMFHGDAQASYYGPEVYTAVRRAQTQYPTTTLLVETFDQALGRFPDGSIDIWHHDGLHLIDAMRHDFEVWLPKMSRRGLMLIHDIYTPFPGETTRHWWPELNTVYPSFAIADHYGLGVLAVGDDYPWDVHQLFEAPADERTALAEFFLAAGRRELTRV